MDLGLRFDDDGFLDVSGFGDGDPDEVLSVQERDALQAKLHELPTPVAHESEWSVLVERAVSGDVPPALDEIATSLIGDQPFAASDVPSQWPEPAFNDADELDDDGRESVEPSHGDDLDVDRVDDGFENDVNPDVDDLGLSSGFAEPGEVDAVDDDGDPDPFPS